MSPLAPRPMRDADFAPMLLLNNAHALELSLSDAPGLQRVLAAASHVRVCGPMDAFLIGMDHTDPYHGLNFAWFRDRFDRFAYVDRVCVAVAARGQGFARALYRDFVAEARRRALPRLCAEVNIEPPNVASNAFHDGMGFVEVGRVERPELGKALRYLMLDLP